MAQSSKPGQPEPGRGSTSRSAASGGDDAASRAAARLPWLLAGWGVSSVLLIAAIAVLLLTDLPLLGVVLFLLGAFGTAGVSIGLLRTRAKVRSPGS